MNEHVWAGYQASLAQAERQRAHFIPRGLKGVRARDEDHRRPRRESRVAVHGIAVASDRASLAACGFWNGGETLGHSERLPTV